MKDKIDILRDVKADVMIGNQQIIQTFMTGVKPEFDDIEVEELEALSKEVDDLKASVDILLERFF